MIFFERDGMTKIIAITALVLLTPTILFSASDPVGRYIISFSPDHKGYSQAYIVDTAYGRVWEIRGLLDGELHPIKYINNGSPDSFTPAP